MCLESPSFSFTNTLVQWRISFAHKYDISSQSGANIEYSTNNGLTWALLDGMASDKLNWYSNASTPCTSPNPGYSGTFTSIFKYSMHTLNVVGGQANVKFRFKLCNGLSNNEGWIIDNFRIEEDKPNIYTFPISAESATRDCPSFKVNTGFIYQHLSGSSFTNTLEYYISHDSLLTASDPVIHSTSFFMFTTLNSSNLLQQLTLPLAFRNAGYKFVFVKWDALNALNESNELDNICMHKIKVDSVYTEPFISSFESSPYWTTNNSAKWKTGAGNKYRFENSQSGINAVYNLGNPTTLNPLAYIESPVVNSKLSDSTTIALWYAAKNTFTTSNQSQLPIQYMRGCPTNSATGGVGGFIVNSNVNRWYHINHYLPIGADSAKNLRIRIINTVADAFWVTNVYGIDIIIDDIYIGKAKPDLLIETNTTSETNSRFAVSDETVDTLRYTIQNCGLKASPASSTAFYWSTDSILNSGDIFMGLKSETVLAPTSSLATQFVYTKPTTAPGKYYILFRIDSLQLVNEMREYNNIGFFTVHQEFKPAFPYFNDFESQTPGWWHCASYNKDDWKLTTPNKPGLTGAFSGVKGWITNDTGYINSNSRMHLYTPVFDLSGTTKPVMEFDIKAPVNGNNTFALAMNMSYSTDGGTTWIVLDTLGKSFNRWYYRRDYIHGSGLDGGNFTVFTGNFYKLNEPIFVSEYDYNGRDCKRVYRYNLNLSRFAGVKKIQFRYNVVSHETNSMYPSIGVMIDNFRLAEGKPDLLFDMRKSLMISSNSTKIKFNGQVKNNGNFVTTPGQLQFLLSADTVIDASDLLLGNENFTFIRPDNYHYFNKIYNAPANLTNYKYLMLRSDITNTNAENSETNNNTWWPLALDSLSNASYFNNFNDTVIDGWHGYSWLSNAVGGWRLRNQVPPAGRIYQHNYASNQLFLDQVASDSWFTAPVFYVQSPKFNFSGCTALSLSFKLFCTGLANVDGCVLEYSTNGGSTFAYLDLTNAQQGAYNYYLSYFNNNKGWSSQFGAGPSPNYFLPVSANLSFLAGQNDVVFRFHYKSKHSFSSGSEHGLRLDDFKITATTVDYKANDINVQLAAPVSGSSLTINYSYSFTQPAFTAGTNIKFYFSQDGIFDSGDQLFLTKPVSAAVGPLTTSDTFTIDLASFSYTGNGSVFYMLDHDSLQVETFENNNIGSFHISGSLVGVPKHKFQTSFNAYIYENRLYINNESMDKSFRLKIIDESGKIIQEKGVNNETGNAITLPDHYAKGLYYVSISQNNNTLTLKYLIN